jgi:ATP-binding cassette, subfamily C, bacterial
MSGAYSAVAFAVMAGPAVMAAELVTATFNPLFVDQILVAERRQWIRPLLLAMGLTLLFRLSIGFIQLAGLRRLKQSLAASHSSRFVWHVLRLPTAFYQQRYVGDVAGRVDSNSAVADLVSGSLATTLVGLLMVVIYGAVMFAFDPVLAAVGVAVGALNMAGIAAVQRILADESIKVKHFGGLLGASLLAARSCGCGPAPRASASSTGRRSRRVSTSRGFRSRRTPGSATTKPIRSNPGTPRP